MWETISVSRFTLLGGVREGAMYYYTIIFWKKDYKIINGAPVLEGRRMIYAKAYEDTRNGVKEMKEDIREWVDEDPVRNGTSGYREE